jgi:hypothetical protein
MSTAATTTGSMALPTILARRRLPSLGDAGEHNDETDRVCLVSPASQKERKKTWSATLVSHAQAAGLVLVSYSSLFPKINTAPQETGTSPQSRQLTRRLQGSFGSFIAIFLAFSDQHTVHLHNHGLPSQQSSGFAKTQAVPC